MKPYTYEKSAIYKRIEAAVKARPLTVIQVCAVACTDRRHGSRILKQMHEKGYIRIGAWRTGMKGPIAPVYHWGAGPDAVKPEPLSNVAKCARYRTALRAKHGENYGVIHAAQKTHIPGRKVVIEGKVIYEQAPR